MTLRELLNVTSLSTRVTIKNNLGVILDGVLLSEMDEDMDLFKPYLNEKVEGLVAEQPYVMEIILRTRSQKEIKQEAYKDFAAMLKNYVINVVDIDVIPVSNINKVLKALSDNNLNTD